jgi:hypothetical protein
MAPYICARRGNVAFVVARARIADLACRWVVACLREGEEREEGEGYGLHDFFCF